MRRRKLGTHTFKSATPSFQSCLLQYCWVKEIQKSIEPYESYTDVFASSCEECISLGGGERKFYVSFGR